MEPYALAMVPCRFVITDPTTGQRMIYGTVIALTAASFPVADDYLQVYLALTDGEGVVNLQLRLCGPDDDPLVAVNFQVTFQDRHQMLETDVRFGRVVFPMAGDYFLRLLAGKTVLAERRLVLLPLSGGES